MKDDARTLDHRATNSKYREDMYFDGKDADGQDAVSRCRPEFLEECDIQNIMHRILKGIPLPSSPNPRMYAYNDHSIVPEYHQALNIISEANQAFSVLPAATRDLFANDPERMLSFLAKEENYDKALEMGLIDPVRAEARAQSKAASEAAKKPKPPAAPKGVDDPA